MPQPAAKPTKPAAGSSEVAIAFMWISLGLMVITILLALFLPSVVGYASCAALYACKLAGERRYGIRSPLTMALLAAYLGLMTAEWRGVDTTGYSGVVLFSWLTVVVGVLLACGRPFTTFYSHGKGVRMLHNTVSVIWLVTYVSALIATLALMPDPLFLFVPAALCLAGGSAMLWVTFVWCGWSNERKKRFENGDLTFRQIDHADHAFVVFCEKYARAIANDPRQGQGTKTWEEIADVVQSAERQLGEHSIVFVCEHQGAIVGSVRCVLDHPVLPLPTERDVDSSFDGLRRYGKLMLIGRLTIDEAYRGRSDILNGLFGSFVDLALERDISFVISAGFTYVLPLYMKLGFEFLYPRRDPRHGVRMSHGFVTYPVILNFEQMVLDRADSDDRYEIKRSTNMYLAERWFKRAMTRRFARRILKRGNLSDIGAIQEVLLPFVPARKAA